VEGDTREAGSDLPPAPSPPHAIEILMAGKPPHEPLRFVTGTAIEQRVFVHRHYSKYGPDPAGLVNTSDRWTVVAQIGPGEHQGSFTGTIGTVLEEVEEFAAFTRVEVGPRGPIGGFEKLREEPMWLHGVLERLMTTLPEEAIGEGAVWQTIVHDAVGPGQDLRVVYELLDVIDGTWHLKGESGQLSVMAPRPEAKAEVPAQPQSNLVVHGEFEVWWKPADPLPHRGRVKEQRTTYASGGADVEVIELVLESPEGGPPPVEDVKGGW
jgi:hypothetical protein